jgi:mitotic spindle assembly checkpoint protein MAD2
LTCVLLTVARLRLCGAGAFELLMYTDNDALVPEEFAVSDPKYIAKSEEMRLRSFSTKVHKVNTAVSYRIDDED